MKLLFNYSTKKEFSKPAYRVFPCSFVHALPFRICRYNKKRMIWYKFVCSKIFLQLMSYLTRLAASSINHSLLLPTISRVTYNCSLTRPGTYSIYCSTKFTLYQRFTMRLLNTEKLKAIGCEHLITNSGLSVSFLTS